MSPRPDPAAGVFDTLLVQANHPVRALAHLGRLADSVQELYGEQLLVGDLAEQLVAAATTGPPLQRLRLVFTPGVGAAVVAQPLSERPRGPLQLGVREVPGGWGAHKWSDRGFLDQGRNPADSSTDLLLVDEDDHLLETGRGTVFLVLDGELVTPPLDGRILPGTTRDVVLGSLVELGLHDQVRPVLRSELRGATEVFTASSIGGVRPVTAFPPDGLSWDVGPVTRAIDAAVERAWSAAR